MHRNGWKILGWKILTAVFQWIHGLVCKKVAKTQPWALPFCVKQSVSFCVNESVSFCVKLSMSFCVKLCLFCVKQSMSFCVKESVSFCVKQSMSFCVKQPVFFVPSSLCLFVSCGLCLFLSNCLRFCVWHHEQNSHVWQQCPLGDERILFCSSLLKNVSSQLHPEELWFKAKSTSVPWYW